MSSSPIKTLSEESLQILRRRGDDARLQNGFRYVRNSSYLSLDSRESPTTVAIPDELESVETFQFLELRPEAAQLAFDYFLQRKAQFPYWANILSAAKDHVMSIKGDADSKTDDWIAVMDRIGLTADYQNRVMDSNYNRMRLTGSAKHWAIEMMTMRFEFLSGLDDLIRTRDQNRMVCYMDQSGQLQLKFRLPASGPTTVTAANWPPAELNGASAVLQGRNSCSSKYDLR